MKQVIDLKGKSWKLKHINEKLIIETNCVDEPEPVKNDIEIGLNEAIKILKNYNNWRRDNYGIYVPASPKKIGIAIDLILDFLINLEK